MIVNDIDLLREYAKSNSDEAFTPLVRRHLDLVYSAALRQVGQPQLAEEVAQSVFVDLARSARTLKPDTILIAWLYRVTRRTAIDVIRRESRRQLRERVAVEMADMNENNPPWKQIEPLLDEAMEGLDERDRSAILLRFFENKSLREVGQMLGTSEDTAQKRVSRAVERLRLFFARRGVAAGAGGIATVLSANAVQSAPAGLMTAISTTAALSLATAHPIGSAALIKTLTMTTTQKALTTTAITLVIGTGIFGARHISDLHRDVESLRQKQAPMEAQLGLLRRERDEATNRLSAMQRDYNQLRRNTADLAWLRGEVSRLRAETRNATQAASDPFVETALNWKEKEAKLRSLMEQSPNLRIPELALLDDRTWLDVARDANLESPAGIRQALSEIRQMAKNVFAPLMSDALRKFTESNDGRLPDDLGQLKSFLDPKITDAMLQRYELLRTGKLADLPSDRSQFAVREKAAIDEDFDRRWRIGVNGYGSDSYKIDQYVTEMEGVFKAYLKANNGQLPKSKTDLIPYLQTPEQKAAYQEAMADAVVGFPTGEAGGEKK